MGKKCDKNVGKNSQALNCFICCSWYHLRCTDVPANVFNAVSNNDSFEYICINCQEHKEEFSNFVKGKLLNLSRNFNISTELSNLKSEVEKNILRLEDSIRKNKQIETIVQPTSKPVILSDIVKRKQSKSVLNNQNSTSDHSATPKPSDNLILHVKGINQDEFKSSFYFKQKLSNVFKNKKIQKCYLKKNGIINIHFMTNEDLLFVEQNWKLFSTSSTVISSSKFLESWHRKKFLVLRDIPPEFSESEILNEIQLQYKSVTKVDRFKKNGGTLLWMLKIELDNENDYQSLLNSDLFLFNIYVVVEKYINIRKPPICRNCWEMGHISEKCINNKRCKVCLSEEHSNANCSNNFKCTNCNGNHLSTDISCPKYQAFLKKYNNMSE